MNILSKVAAAGFNSDVFISTPTATPAAFGDSFEGGFYAGQIWNQLIQSSESTTIGTGSKTFTVSAAAAYAYYGQAVEVRSRANPDNKMIGTVTSASLSSVTINVTSVGGSGTYTDWSIMSKYRIIVAPVATGETYSMAFGSNNPPGADSATEGKLNTVNITNDGNSATYPAAWFCKNLSIGGYADWYLPARDELELVYRNLKPDTTSNYTTVDRLASQSPGYLNLGSYNDTDAHHGHNVHSSPTGADYTAGTPAQVAAGKNFRVTESEALDNAFWTSTHYSGAGHQCYQAAATSGYQGTSPSTDSGYVGVRAVRRSII